MAVNPRLTSKAGKFHLVGASSPRVPSPRLARLGRGIPKRIFMHYVYILHSYKLNKLYKGNCVDLKIRLDDHNKHRVKVTKSGAPWRLVYYQAFISKTDAIREENFLKTGKGRERVKYLLKDFFNNLK